MTIEIIKFAQPKCWISLVAGGSLTVGQVYYFFCFVVRGGAYYGEITSQASQELSITPTIGNQTIKVEWWQDGGAITAFADAGGGQVTITANAHGRNNGDTAYIRGSTNYDGTYTIANVTPNTFEITAPWNGDDGTSNWFADIGYHSKASGVFFKWDKYTMIDAGDGKPYQWLNLNDPANAAKSEFDDTYGHRRWSGQKFSTWHTGNSINFTQEAVNSTYVQGYLYDGVAVGSNRIGGDTRSLTDICWREQYYPLDSNFARDKGKLCVYITGTGNTTRTLINALKASGYTDMYIICESYYTWNVGNSITILGGIFSDNSAETEFNDTSFILVGGQFCYCLYSGGEVVTNRCNIFQHALSVSQWYAPEAVFNDTVVMCQGNSMILDNSSGVGFTPKFYSGIMCYYNKIISNTKLIGGYGVTYFQWRYQRANNTSHMTDFYIKDYNIYLVDRPGNYTGYMTNVEFVNNGLQNYDVHAQKNYINADCDKIMECFNVTCDRPDGKIIVYSNPSAYAVTDTWNMRFGIDLTIIDETGNGIDGANIKLSWAGGCDTDTTDVNGEAEVIGLSYQLTWDSTSGEGNMATSVYKELTLTVKKKGYQSHKSKFVMTKPATQPITLKRISINIDNEVLC